jgi:hypothetical protein
VAKRKLTYYRLQYLKLKVAEKRRELKSRAIGYKGGRCEDCGFEGHSSAFDFHHTDRSTKDFQLSSGNIISFPRMIPELDKCALLCANCHRTRHGLEHDASLERRRASLAELREQERPKQGRMIATVQKPCVTCGFLKEVPVDRRVVVCSKTCLDQHNQRNWPEDEWLKELVWSKPYLQVAQELGVSAKSVARRCKDRGIATPAIGYWSKQGYTASTKAYWPSDEELASVVMQAPMTQLAKQLGVTETAVRKRCKTRNIPTPPRGHWAKQASVASPS